ncbi:MAG: NrsF family protein [Burkholderiales bacterium]
MRTDDLVTLLATGAGAVRPNQAARRYAIALGWGAAGAALLMAILLGPRHDFAAAMMMPMFWAKIAFVTSFAAASLLAALRLSRPGLNLVWVPGVLGAPVLAIWLLAAVVLVRADEAQRKVLFFGDTWNSCPFLIALLSAPVFVAVVWAMKGLAPTRLRLAGAAAGLLAGAVGTMVYSVHCPELAAPFIGFWYLLGILIPTAVGALLGPRLLRW